MQQNTDMGSGEVCKRVVINGNREISGLVDRGSTDCIMRATAVVLFGLQVVQREFEIFGFGSMDDARVKTLDRLCYGDASCRHGGGTGRTSARRAGRCASNGSYNRT